VFSEWKDRQWMLVKVSVGTQERVVLRQNGVPNATPAWSPVRGPGAWITWESRDGLVLVSPDGSEQRPLYSGQFLVHTWSADGHKLEAQIVGFLDPEHLLAILRGDVWIPSGLHRRSWFERLQYLFRRSP
jgi:hypothetical protein